MCALHRCGATQATVGRIEAATIYALRVVKYNGLALERRTLLDERYLPGSVRQREARLSEARVRGLEVLRRRIEDATGEKVPHFDPDSAGVEAEALFVLRDPSTAAAEGSGFISIDNNDPTARANTMFYDQTGLDRKRTLHWNAVPWEVGSRPIAREASRARPYLLELVQMLERLKVIVVLGKPARESWELLYFDPGVPVIKCPHPNPQAWHRMDQGTGRSNKDVTIDAFVQVVRILG